MIEDPSLWGKRPLSKECLLYASDDVIYLIKAWANLKEMFNENLLEIVYFLTILKVVDFQMFLQFGEFLSANVLYYSMLEGVFTSKLVYENLFALDYVYGYFHIKGKTEAYGNGSGSGYGCIGAKKAGHFVKIKSHCHAIRKHFS